MNTRSTGSGGIVGVRGKAKDLVGGWQPGLCHAPFEMAIEASDPAVGA